MSVYAERQVQNRLFLAFLLLVSLLIFAAYRLVVIQIFEAPRYSQLAQNQRLRFIELAPHRGTIYDRNGKELALSINAYAIYATPYFIKNPEDAAKKLSPVLNIDQEVLCQKLAKKSGFVYLLRKAEPEIMAKVKKLEIEGIGFLKENKRVYPCESLGSHVIGFVGTDNNGLVGLELYYDEVLKGEAGKLLAERDPQGRIIPGSFVEYSQPSDGKSIVLTIDREIQHKAEIELKKQVEKYQAKGGSVIVMSPKTGEILAMANCPTFDLNNFSNEKEEVFKNRAIVDVYELGSVMKSFIAAGALEKDICEPGTIYHLPETIKVADKVIKEAHPRLARDFTFTEIITESSNVGIVTIGQELGKDSIYKCLADFGFTEKTGIDFPGETIGYMPPPDEWSATTIGNIPFGQGISASTIQLLRAYAIIANGGFIVQPHFFRKSIDSQGKSVREYQFREGKRVISEKTAKEMCLILEQVVEAGTGNATKIEGYRVAGKTGTAQKPLPGCGYKSGKYISSFVGFAPAENPEIIALVVIDEPQGAYYGGVVAAPVFKNVVEFSLNHLKVSPSELERGGDEN